MFSVRFKLRADEKINLFSKSKGGRKSRAESYRNKTKPGAMRDAPNRNKEGLKKDKENQELC